MARLFIEGFEHGRMDQAMFSAYGTGVYGTGITGIADGMTGSYCVQGNNNYDDNSHWFDFELPSSKSQIYSAFKIMSYQPDDRPLMAFYDSNGTVIASAIMIYSATPSPHFTLRILRGAQSGGTILGTGTKEIPFDSTFLFEVGYVPLDSGGSIIAKINGVVDVNYSGDTTAGIENIAKVRWGRESYKGLKYTKFDDLVLDDANWIGNTRIQKLQINAAGTTTQWTASTGSPYQCIDEITYSDTDFVYVNVVDQSLTCACADLTGDIDSIKCLIIAARMAYEGNPTPTQQKIAIRVNGSEYYGDDESPGLSFDTFYKMWEINPDDSNSWEEADINAIEIGVRSVA